MYNVILVPIDDSGPARKGLLEAIALAKALGSRLHVLHVVDLRALITGVAAYAPSEQLMADWKQAGELLVAKAVDQVREHGVSVDTAVACDPGLRVCDAILEEARRSAAGLIVMGTHGRRGLSRLALGSDAELVVRDSPVPVMLVRAS
jgi:nucleotide-binding universal stress UspA family protein